MRLEAELIRRWPGMHTEAATAPRAGRASDAARPPRSCPPPAAAPRDASHFAATVPITVDGLGPRGGKAHNPEEFVLEASLQPRAEVALAVILSAAPNGAVASASSSRGRSSTSSSPALRGARSAATPPFLKSTRAPVKS